MNEDLERLKARAEVYRLLSRAYHAPERDLLKGQFVPTAKNAIEVLGSESFAKRWERLVHDFEAEYEPTEIALEYTRLFRGPVKAEAYPYESMHVDGEPMGASTLDVMRCYQNAGVAIAEDFKDLPDHISAELEFMHYLCMRELDILRSGTTEGASRFKRMRQAFLSDHIGKWVPLMCRRIREFGKTRFYSNLAVLTEDWVYYDQKLPC